MEWVMMLLRLVIGGIAINKIDKLNPIFVEFIPEELQHGNIYISQKYNTAIHLCCCGCGNQVVTPTSLPAGWKIDIDDDLISLSPSIGSWNLPCRSHYIIKHNEVQWCEA